MFYLLRLDELPEEPLDELPELLEEPEERDTVEPEDELDERDTVELEERLEDELLTGVLWLLLRVEELL